LCYGHALRRSRIRTSRCPSTPRAAEPRPNRRIPKLGQLRPYRRPRPQLPIRRCMRLLHRHRILLLRPRRPKPSRRRPRHRLGPRLRMRRRMRPLHRHHIRLRPRHIQRRVAIRSRQDDLADCPCKQPVGASCWKFVCVMKNRLEASFKKARPLQSRFKRDCAGAHRDASRAGCGSAARSGLPRVRPALHLHGLLCRRHGLAVAPGGGAGAFPPPGGRDAHRYCLSTDGLFDGSGSGGDATHHLGSAEIYMRVREFTAHDNRFVTVRILPLTTLYLISAKNAPPEVVEAVLARAKRGEPVPGRRGKADGPRVQEPESPGSPMQSPPRTVFLRTRAGERRALLRRKFAIRAFGEVRRWQE
jgi:hypothetical protein